MKEVVKILLEHGADVNFPTLHGETPLMRACKKNYNYEEIRVLLDAGADVSLKDKEGKTSLYRYIKSGGRMTKILSAFIHAGLNLNDEEEKIRNDFVYARIDDPVGFAEELLEC